MRFSRTTPRNYLKSCAPEASQAFSVAAPCEAQPRAYVRSPKSYVVIVDPLSQSDVLPGLEMPRAFAQRSVWMVVAEVKLGHGTESESRASATHGRSSRPLTSTRKRTT